MSWQRSPLFFVASVISASLLVIAMLFLIPSLKGADQTHPSVALSPEKIEVAFPSNFGSLIDLVPFSGGASPIAEEVPQAPVVEHAPEFRDDSWLKAQPATAYTIQILAVQDEEGIKRYLEGRTDRDKFEYFQRQQEGQSWYVLIYGRYPSLELARGVTESTDFGGVSRPFAKIIQSYQTETNSLPASAPASAPAP